ncbi:MAG: hypothetical protein GY851_30775, partial [bacterium]|nr:hypothetical protein [bacterium]
MSTDEHLDEWTEPVTYRHFPDRLHAFVWRNWQLVPLERMAEVVGADVEALQAIGARMGLGSPPSISRDQEERSYVTVLRRNWHLLPHDQLCAVLDWTPDRFEYTLREGDGLFWWFGQYTPRLEPLRYAPPSADAITHAERIGTTIRTEFGDNVASPEEPLFQFVEDLSTPPPESPKRPGTSAFTPRYCYSYFAPFRNPLGPDADPFPDGYLARLAAVGVDGVIIHEPLYHLVEFPWDPSISEGYEDRIARFQELADRAGTHGIRIYLYLNEPRPMPTAFFDTHPELRGVMDRQVQIDKVCTLCTSVPAVQDYLRDGVAAVCRAVPELGAVFTISASESYTNCWSHYSGDECARCGPRGPEEVIAEANTLLWEGIAASGSDCRLIVWDWGWKDEWAEGIIARLPKQAALQSVSEWSLPIERGGVEATV